MSKNKQKSSIKEVIIGLTGGIGSDFDSVINDLEKEFSGQNMHCEDIKLTDLAENYFSKPYKYKGKKYEIKRIHYYMNECSELRKETKKKSLLALFAINEIQKKREEITNEGTTPKDYIIYILNSLKRPEEANLLRQIYGRNFILISIHTDEDKKIKSILKKDSDNKEKEKRKIIENMKSILKKDYNSKEKEIRKLIEKDNYETNERLKEYGQNLIGTYPNAHFFLDTEKDLRDSIKRFVDILFGHPFHTPEIDERNMFVAKGISLRSADLSRQVGAVIAKENGEIIATGCNEVPKFGGGQYEPRDKKDGRDFQKGEDTNVEEKKKILEDLFRKLIFLKPENEKSLNKIYKKLEDADSKITSLLEFGRPIHAELAAICDAAKRGIPLKDTTLYCTTFSCHLCIKHIICVGIKRVVYIDPYPKSKAETHFDDSVTNNNEANKVQLNSFIGVSPRRYLHVFKQEKRKNKGTHKPEKAERKNKSSYLQKRFLIDYHLRELAVIQQASNKIGKKLNELNANPKLNVNPFELNNDKFDKLNEAIKNLSEWAEKYWKDVVK